MRLRSIDILRALAILLVLFRHLDYDNLPMVLHYMKKIGWMGVDMFFVLSGFLVSGLLFYEYKKKNEIKPVRFLVRRGFKIYPSFYALILLVVAVKYIKHVSFNRGDLMAELFFYQNYHPSLLGHTWSLAVEEHFYILLSVGLFAYIHYAKNMRKLPYIIISLLVVILGMRYITYTYHLYNFKEDFQRYCMSHLRFDALFFGVLLSFMYHFHPDAFNKYLTQKRGLILIFSIICLLPCLLLPTDSNIVGIWGLSLNYLGFGGLLICALSVETFLVKHNNWLLSFLCIIGVNSYSIYLWHIPFEALIKLKLTSHIHNAALYMVIYGLSSIAVGIVLGKVIEIPFLHLREKLVKPQYK